MIHAVFFTALLSSAWGQDFDTCIGECETQTRECVTEGYCHYDHSDYDSCFAVTDTKDNRCFLCDEGDESNLEATHRSCIANFCVELTQREGDDCCLIGFGCDSSVEDLFCKHGLECDYNFTSATGTCAQPTVAGMGLYVGQACKVFSSDDPDLADFTYDYCESSLFCRFESIMNATYDDTNVINDVTVTIANGGVDGVCVYGQQNFFGVVSFKPGDCTSDADCPVNEKCEDRDPDDALLGRTCVAGLCVDGRDSDCTCYSDYDCKLDQFCRWDVIGLQDLGGKCKKWFHGNYGDACEDSEWCGDGLYCTGDGFCEKAGNSICDCTSEFQVCGRDSRCQCPPKGRAKPGQGLTCRNSLLDSADATRYFYGQVDPVFDCFIKEDLPRHVLYGNDYRSSELCGEQIAVFEGTTPSCNSIQKALPFQGINYSGGFSLTPAPLHMFITLLSFVAYGLLT